MDFVDSSRGKEEEVAPPFEEPPIENDVYYPGDGETKSDRADEEEALLNKQLSRSGSKNRLYGGKNSPRTPRRNLPSPAKGNKDSSSKRKRLHNKPKQREHAIPTPPKNQRGRPSHSSCSKEQQQHKKPIVQLKSYAAAVAEGHHVLHTNKKSALYQRLLTHDMIRKQQDAEKMRPRGTENTSRSSMDDESELGPDFWAAFAKPCDDFDRPLLVAALAQPQGKTEADVDTLFAAELGGPVEDLRSREDSHSAPMHWIELKGVALASLPESLLLKESHQDSAEEENCSTESPSPLLFKMSQPLRMVGLDLTGCVLKRQREVLEPVACLAKSLRCLDVSRLNLRNLPASWAALECLVCLRASHNQLRSWPAELLCICKERNTMTHNRGGEEEDDYDDDDDEEEEIDVKITPLGVSLRQLDLSSNGLTELPASIGCMPRLAWLDVSTNLIAHVDDAIFAPESSPKLQRLDLRNNVSLQALGSAVAGFLTRPKKNNISTQVLLQNCDELHTPPRQVADLGAAAIARFYAHYNVADNALECRRHRAYLARRDTLWLDQIREIERRSLLREAETEALSTSDDPPSPPRLRSWTTLSSSNGGFDTASVAESYLPQESEDSSSLCYDAVDGGQRIASLVLRLELEIKHCSETASRGASKRDSNRKCNGSIPRVSSDSEVTSLPETPRDEDSSRLARASNDLYHLKRILKRLACDQALEVFACFCAPRAVKMKQHGQPPVIVNLDESHQLQLMRELRAMIEAVPAPQREIVPAARWPDDIINALLRRQSSRNGKSSLVPHSPHRTNSIFDTSDDDTDHLGPLMSQHGNGLRTPSVLSSPQFGAHGTNGQGKKHNFFQSHWTEPPPLKPRIFHFAGHCFRVRGAAPSLVFLHSVDALSTDDERRNDSYSSSQSASRRHGRLQLGDLATMPNHNKFVEVLRICDGLECLFLNACKSFVLGEKIIDELGHTGLRVICWKTRVADVPASHFARFFYEQIGNNPCIDVRKAYKNAFDEWKKHYRLGDPDAPGNEDLSPSLRPQGIPAFIKPRPSQLAPADDSASHISRFHGSLPPPIADHIPPAALSSSASYSIHTNGKKSSL